MWESNRERGLGKQGFPQDQFGTALFLHTGLVYNEDIMKKTVVIVPLNDPEAVLISQLAEALGLPVIKSQQPHGASLDKGRDFVTAVCEENYKRVVVVEMPGPKSEVAIKEAGIELVIIDHHHYDDLDRARDKKTGKLLYSSLEQFLKLFRLGDARLKKMGFNPRLVRGIGLMDRGFVWALERAHYSPKEVKAVLAYWRELMRVVKEPKNEKEKQKIVQAAWDQRKKWHEFFVVQDESHVGLRSKVSLLVAEVIGKPTPLIVVEKKRGFIYVQESAYAQRLLKRFGGFTFGMERNWGYRNAGARKKVSLDDLKDFLTAVE